MGEHSARAIAVRTTLSAAAAELTGEWDEVEFLATSVALLPEPEEVAWAAMFLAKANLSLVDPVPDPAEAATAAAACASQGYAPDGAPFAASTLLATAVRSLTVPSPIDPAPVLVASTGMLLREAPEPSAPTAAGLFAAVAYSFVRSAVGLGVDPLDKVDRLIARFS